MDLSKLCTPAMLYLVIAGISVVIGLFQKLQLWTLLVKVVFVGAWTWFLNFLCSKGYKTISWFLVLLPFLLMIGVFAIAYEVVKSGTTNGQGTNMPSQQQQVQHH